MDSSSNSGDNLAGYVKMCVKLTRFLINIIQKEKKFVVNDDSVIMIRDNRSQSLVKKNDRLLIELS